jgi:hypothetical protein
MLAYADLNEDDLRNRAAHKQRGRDEDERVMAEGHLSPIEVQRRNSMVSGFDMNSARLQYPASAGRRR